MTQLIRDFSELNSFTQDNIVTIGNFDGVHLGHQALLTKVVQQARLQKLSTIMLSFAPHPQEFFAKTKIIKNLTSLREKFFLISQQQIDKFVLVRFNKKFSEISADDFIQDFLAKKLRARHLIVGHDFRFGKNRLGDFNLLQQQKYFTVEQMPAFLLENQRVSSSKIREILSAGDFVKAKNWLGRPWTISGHVMYGAARGRLIGFPTANIFLGERALPIAGVYMVRVHGINQSSIAGVANVGVRPTVDGTKQILEVHLFNFNGDLYGRRVTVEFCQKIRDEIRFANLDLLKQQIAQDADAARQYFILHGEL